MGYGNRLRIFLLISVLMLTATLLHGCSIAKLLGRQESPVLRLEYGSFPPEVYEQIPLCSVTKFIYEIPTRYDFDLIYEKGLSDKKDAVNMDYQVMQTYYRKALIMHIAKKLDLEKYDDELANSGLDFISHPGDSYLGAKYYLGTRYVMVINICHIEQLDETDLELIRRTLQAGNTGVTDEVAEMVARTWPEVIKYRADEEVTYYEMLNKTPLYKFPNNALVIGIGTVREYDSRGNVVDWDKEKEKDAYLEDFCTRMEKELNEKMEDVPVKVFKFTV
ncbi:MAG: hypothetical protein WAP56_02575 [Acetivibrionales bacterium]